MNKKAFSKASVYVGTYAKYNAGSIYGDWLMLSDYADIEDFYEACRELHADEEDPEFMFQDWEVEAELESGENLEITLGDSEGDTPWRCGGIEYKLEGERYYESEDTDTYEYYRMVGDIKDTLAKVAKLRDGQVERRFDEHWVTIYAVKVMLYPEEFTEEEKKTVTRMLQLVLHC